MSWLRVSETGNRVGVDVGTGVVFVAIDGKSERSSWNFHALKPWEARQLAHTLNVAADNADPGGSAEPPKADGA